jgi:hypothetical protein
MERRYIKYETREVSNWTGGHEIGIRGLIPDRGKEFFFDAPNLLHIVYRTFSCWR